MLTDEEIGLARALAEHDLTTHSLPSGPRNVFIKVDLLPDSQAESARRLVMVHHYRYPTDETIFTMIDLQTHEVLNRETYAHYPTALAAGGGGGARSILPGRTTVCGRSWRPCH